MPDFEHIILFLLKGSQGYLSTFGGLSVAVPLELKGLEAAHKMYGRLPWKTLLEPAINLARNGFTAHPYFVKVSSIRNKRGYAMVSSFPSP